MGRGRKQPDPQTVGTAMAIFSAKCIALVSPSWCTELAILIPCHFLHRNLSGIGITKNNR